IEEVERLNEKLLAKMDYATAAEKLAALGVKIDEKLWQAFHGNIKKLGEVADWLKIINGEIAEPSVEDKEYLQIAASLLPVGDWDENSWGIWTKAISAATGRKGKELFMPIRKALTGLEHGPEMKLLLPIIGRDKVLQRLN
ncbi:MAG: glutamate--tRNA ligase, partial [Pseudomonadota bacterium]